MLLHEDKELFHEVIISTAEALEQLVPIVEKDYYVTLLLKELSQAQPNCVFKGGTSLSKCHHAIDRFSEDIDISFIGKLTQGMRKNLKDGTIAGISKTLNMPILDWENARSKRDYNCYTFGYEPINGFVKIGQLIPGVKMEISLSTESFPVIELPVDSYVYQFLARNNMDIVEKYNLFPFKMNVQGIDRTLIDKVFALCDYYMQNNITRHSRHIYDIYMLLPKVNQDSAFKALVKHIRSVRKKLSSAPSAKDDIDIPKMLLTIIEKRIYEADYKEITTYFQNRSVDYETVIGALKEIAIGGMFET